MTTWLSRLLLAAVIMASLPVPAFAEGNSLKGKGLLGVGASALVPGNDYLTPLQGLTISWRHPVLSGHEWLLLGADVSLFPYESSNGYAPVPAAGLCAEVRLPIGGYLDLVVGAGAQILVALPARFIKGGVRAPLGPDLAVGVEAGLFELLGNFCGEAATYEGDCPRSSPFSLITASLFWTY